MAILIVISVVALALVALALWFVLALAAAVPWWVIMAYYALRGAERATHTLAGRPRQHVIVVTRADARVP